MPRCASSSASAYVMVDKFHAQHELLSELWLLTSSHIKSIAFSSIILRLQVPDISYPRQWGRDVEPLYKHVRVEDQYSKAVRQVRGTGV